MTHEQVFQQLESLAMSFQGAELGKSCKKKSVKIGKKSILFLGQGKSGPELILKLQESLEQARAIEKQHPESCKVGKSGWVTLQLANPELHDSSKAWVRESHKVQTKLTR